MSRGFRQGDIAVLGRKKEQLEQFTQWLIEEGYCVQSERTANLREHPLIKQIIAFLQFLHSPVDNTAFAAFISGDLFMGIAQIPHAEIVDLLFSSNSRVSGQKAGYLYIAFRDRWEKQWSTLIEPFFTTAGFVPLYELITRFFGTYAVLTRYPGQRLFVERFLTLVHEHRDDHAVLDSFLEFFMDADDKELFVAAEDEDAIRLMTIHGAKGLQFPVVILPQLTMSIKHDDIYFVPDANGLRIVKPLTQRDTFSSELDAFARDEMLETLMAELNALYVALTRASEEMYIFMPHDANGNSKNRAPLLFDDTDTITGLPERYSCAVRDKEDVQRIDIPVREYRAEGLFVSDDLFPAPSLERREARRRGVLVHAALARLGNLYGKQIHAEVCRVVDDLMREEGEAPACADIERIAAHPALAPFFAPKDAAVLCEHAVVTGDGSTRVFDRLVEFHSEVWIIDFKSTTDAPEDHHAQVLGYLRAARDLYPQKTRRGWIIYLDSCTPVAVSEQSS
jgi:ATP-dependent exoDNAse (exonuclease V) beta subunit